MGKLSEQESITKIANLLKQVLSPYFTLFSVKKKGVLMTYEGFK